MGGVGDELAAGLVDAFQLLGHGVVAFRQLPQFAGAPLLHAHGQVALGHLADGGGQGGNGPGYHLGENQRHGHGCQGHRQEYRDQLPLHPAEAFHHLLHGADEHQHAQGPALARQRRADNGHILAAVPLQSRAVRLVNTPGGGLPAGEDSQHLRQLQPRAAQLGVAVSLYLAVTIHHQQPPAHLARGGNEGLGQG